MTTVFLSYSHADEDFRKQLEKQLSMLRRQNVIDIWSDRCIDAGENFEIEIDSRLKSSDLILLLVSPDFLASDYCYEKEMLFAVERHQQGAAIVIPIILRPCDWHSTPFGKILATPRDGKPITLWADRDEALLDVVQAIRRLVAGNQANGSKAASPRSSGSPFRERDLIGSHWMIYPAERQTRRELWLSAGGHAKIRYRGLFEKQHAYHWSFSGSLLIVWMDGCEYRLELDGDKFFGEFTIDNPPQNFAVHAERVA